MKHSACDLIEKEADILKEIVQLKSIRDMALEFHITERTVKYRISRIFEKTGTKNQRELLKKKMNSKDYKGLPAIQTEISRT